MELHQILTGSCNDNDGCIAYGSLVHLNFIVYGSGRDIIILDDNFVRNNIISGSKFGIDHINILSCTNKSGNILAVNLSKAFIFNPSICDAISDLKSINWYLLSVIDAVDIINCVSWLPNNSDTVIFGNRHIQLWKMQKTNFTIGDDTLKIQWKCFSSLRLPDNEIADQLEFSSDGRYFATWSKQSTKICIWFCTSNSDFNQIEKIEKEQEFIDYLVLNHPNPIISFEWRENSNVMPKYFMKNFLLTCCEDNICRIWSENHIISEYNELHSSISMQTKYFKENVVSNNQVLFDIEKIQINKSDDTPKPISYAPYPRFVLRTSIDNITEVPLLSNLYKKKHKQMKFPLTFHWLNNKKFYFDKIIYDIVQHIKHCKIDLSAPEIEYYTRLFLKELQKTVKSTDTIFSFLPIKGSLITWHVHNLDDTFEIYSEEIQNFHCTKNGNATVHSCLPDCIPVADALSMDSKLLLFSFMNKPNICPETMFRTNFLENKNLTQDITMISKQKNGSLNLWNFSLLNDLHGNSSILNIKHISRISGHRWQTHTASCHIQLPLLLTSSNFIGDDHSKGISDLSELILWRLKGVGPFSQIGGIREVARINSKTPCKFSSITWFPGLIPANIFTHFNISSPCSLFTASQSTNNKISIYLSVPEANDLLKKHQYSSSLRSELFDDELIPCNSINHHDEAGCDRIGSNTEEMYQIVSLTSSGEPGCMVFMEDLTQSQYDSTPNQEVITKFLHVYPSDMISETQHKFPKKIDQSLVEFIEIYYVVRVLEIRNKLNDLSENIFEMWKIKIYEIQTTPCQNATLENLINVRLECTKIPRCTFNCSSLMKQVVPAASHLSSASIYPECMAPYLMATICEDKFIRFWKCHIDSNNQQEIHWSEWCMKTAMSQNSQIELSNSRPLYVSCAYSGRLAVLYQNQQDQLILVIHECESTGGSEWSIEDTIELNDISKILCTGQKITMDKIHIDWINSEDGSHLLSLGFNTQIYIYSPTNVDCTNNTTTNTQRSIKCSKWIKIKEINLNRPNSSSYSSIEHVSWAREGLMIVGVDNEIHVYNQWNATINRKIQCDLEKRRNDSLKGSFSYARLEDTYKSNKFKSVQNDSSKDMSFLSNIGLFEVLQLHNPILPQYHPKQLLEWINFGKIRRVKAILSHLTECICGGVNQDKDDNSYANSDNNARLEIKAIPPLPLYVLLNIDKSTSEPDVIDGDIEKEETIDDFDLTLADDNAVFQNSPSPNTKEITWKPHDGRENLANYSQERASALSNSLIKVQLPGITTLDQIYLLGISEIMCNIKDESISCEEKKISTKVNSANSLDDCGLRFLLAMQHYCRLCKTLPMNQRNNIVKDGLDMSAIIWGFHSETEGELCKMLYDITHDNVLWSDFKRYGCGWWIRNDTLLQTVIEKVAKNTFQYTKDPMDSSIFYLAMGKQKLLAKLFKNCNKTSLYEFFSLDFQNEEHKNRALNQAYKMRSKRKYEHAMALFLLCDCLNDSLLIALFNLKDIQLAITIVRLNRIYKKTKLIFPDILRNQILNNSNPFIRSMGYWMVEEYMDSLTTLLQEIKCDNDLDAIVSSNGQTESNYQSGSTDTIVFVFYNYLKYHPLINKYKSVGTWESYSAMERRLYFRTAYRYFKLGCPDLSLEVLSSLPYEIEDMGPGQEKDKNVNNSKKEEKKKTNPDILSSGLITWDDFEDDDIKPQEFKIEFDADDNDDADHEVNKLNDDEDDGDDNEMSLTTTGTASREFDIMNLQYKFIICIKLISEELCTLASGIDTSGCCLRSHVYHWLEKEVKVIHDICFPKPQSEEATDDLSHVDHLYLSNLDSESHKLWLKTNKYLLLSLYNFCATVSPSNIGLGAIKMELLILLQELQGTYNEVLQQFSALPQELKLPFLVCSLTPETGIILNPIQQIKANLSDIANIITSFKLPQIFLSMNCETNPTVNTETNEVEETDKAYYILNLCQNLSAALFQCLSFNQDDNSPGKNKRKRLNSLSVLYTPEADLQIRSKYFNENEDIHPNSDPKQWPGFTSFISLFGLKGKSLNSNYAYTLTEVLVVIYVGMLIYSFKVNDSSLIYRLVNIKFDKKLWGKIFGGTLRKKPQRPELPGVVSPKRSRDDSQHTPTIISHGGSSYTSSGSGGESKSLAPPQKPQPPTLDEKFVIPYSSILTTLLEKPIFQGNNIYDYDSDSENKNDKMNDDNIKEDYEDEDEDEYDFDDSFNRECENNLSYTWCLIKLVSLNAINLNIASLLSLIKMDPSELPIVCPNIFSIIKVISQWETILKRHLLGLKEIPISYKEIIKECDSEIFSLKRGASNTEKLGIICKLLTNMPFKDIHDKYKPMKRLWMNLIQKSEFQPLFIQNFIHLKDIHNSDLKQEDSKQKSDNINDSLSNSTGGNNNITQNNNSTNTNNISSNNSNPHHSNSASIQNNIKIVHKEHEMLYSIAVNQNDKSLLVTSTGKEIIELNVENLIDPKKWIDDDYEYLSDLLKENPKSELNFSHDFLLATPIFGTYLDYSPDQFLSNHNAASLSKLILKRPVAGCQILKSHPRLPYYLSGNNNGQVSVYEWGMDGPIVKTYAPIQKGKITSLNFHHSGNKFGMGDSEGIISLCHFSYADNSKSHYFQTKCPHKNVLDFCFLNSSSLIATCGGSGISGISTVNHLHAVGGGISTFDSNSINISVWDVLLPNGRNQIKSFADPQIAMGVTSLCYVSKYERLLFGTRKGDIGFIDIRKNCLGSFIQAHDNTITSIKLDPLQQYFITSSADGFIKIWNLLNSELLTQYRSESTKTSVFSKGDTAIKCLDLIDDDKIITCGNDGLIRLRYIQNLIINSDYR